MIKLASPDIQQSDIQNAASVLKSGHLVQGQQVIRFENSLSRMMDLPYCSVVSSGTAALHLALLSFGIGQGDSVIVPAFTFPATANAVENVGGKTILCDVDPNTYVVSPENIEKLIFQNKDKKIRAIIVVHEFGYPAQIKTISQIAKKNHIFLIEDAACALGTVADARHVGHYSDLACFSFHPRKAVTTGEGGAVATRSKKIAESIKRLRNHGLEIVDGKNDFVASGLNYRLTDFQAALALGQLSRFGKELRKRKQLVKVYFEGLTDQENVKIPRDHPGHSWQSFMVVLKKEINRQKLIEKLLRRGIETNYGAYALNCLNFFQKKYRYQAKDFPVATCLYERGLVLPLYGRLSLKDISKIIEILIEEVRNVSVSR